MKIRTKILSILGIGIIAIILFATIILKAILISYIEKQETGFVYDDYKRVLAMLEREGESLERTVLDWTIWDDTYWFLENKNGNFIDVNMEDSTLHTLDLNFMIFLDKNGNKAYSKLIGIENDGILERGLLDKLSIPEHFPDLNSLEEPLTGALMVLNHPVLLSAAPITSSDEQAPYNGVLILGRLIDSDLIQYLEEVLQIGIGIKTASLEDLSESGYKEISFSDKTIRVNKSKQSIISYAPINDIYDNEELFFVLNSERKLYRNGVKRILFFSIFFLIAQAFVVSICVFGIEKLITKPLKKLHSFMGTVGEKKDTTARLNLSGTDELSELAVTANVMLKELDNSYTYMRIMEERFRLIMEATNDGYFDINLAENKFYIGPEWMRFMGYEEGEYYKNLDKLSNIIHPEDKDEFIKVVNECLTGRLEQIRLEFRAPKKNGEWLWILARGKLVEIDKQGRPVRYVGTISDINMQKKFEEENNYLIQTDVVTTLKSRTYIETILQNKEKCSACVYWIVMGDVNGLKIINDSFGHQQGDKLLRAIGMILKECCSEKDIPARWGGDEFIILVKNGDNEYVDKLIQKIKNELDNMTGFPVKISMALGWAQNNKEYHGIDDIIKSAEERMYRNKLLESRSARSAILSSLEQSLHEKHIETEEHTKRIKQLCLEVGKSIGLSQDELDELALLGVLHDMGKIAIPEAVLMKPDKLSPKEWEIMKTHAEIGYRIAASTPELAHIADKILCHHERYDGSGYPQGLKGDAIPKLSRLLSIVDSFDVMTHDRHYQKAISVESAVQELKDCAGKQFDAELVDYFLTLLEEKKRKGSINGL